MSMNLVRLGRLYLPALLIICLAYTPLSLALQEELETVVGQELIEDIEFTDNLGRDTPRSSFVGFLTATEKFNYDQAAQYMDLRNLPHSARQYDADELAQQLDFIIKRGMKINIEQLSAKVSGQIVDGLPDYRDELGHLISKDGEQVLFMQRVPGLGDNYIWKISNASVAHIPELYDYFSYPDWVEKIREKLPNDASFLGVELFKWVIILGAALVLFPLFWLIGFIVSWLISRPGAPLHVSLRRLFTRPIPFLLTMLITSQLLKELGLGARAQALVEAKTLMTVVVVWLIFSFIDLFREKRRHRFIAQGRADAHILGRPLANSLKLFTILASALVWLSNAGVEISALLAGLGIGGVALALALQKPIEDLLGAVSLYSQQPMQTGDLCRYGTVLGVIQEIGLRTTRIRTLNDTLVSVPNFIIAHGPIENFSAREKMLYHPELNLRYDTTVEQVQIIMDNLTTMAQKHDKVIDNSVRVVFTELSQNALILRARIYVDESDFSGYLAVVSELNLEIMKIVQNAGTQFAQGAQTVLLEQASTSTRIP